MQTRTATRAAAICALELALAGCDGNYGCTIDLIDVCQKAADIGTYVGTDAASAIAGGNVVMTEGGALHVPAKMSFSLRTNVIGRSSPVIGLPTLRTDGTAGNSTFGIREGNAASYTVDAAFGALPGFRLGETRVGGVDVLGSATLVPVFGSRDLRVRSRGGLGYGAGVRLGLIEETRALPGLSVSAMWRQAPRFTGRTASLPMDDGREASISFTRIDVKTETIRLAASKRFGRFGLTGGLGRDGHDVTTEYSILVSGDPNTYTAVPTAVESTRNNAFGGVSLALGKATLGVELGTVFAGEKPFLVNTFGSRPIDRARTYVSFGVKMSAGRTDDSTPRVIRP
jgi:hypothetical protein